MKHYLKKQPIIFIILIGATSHCWAEKPLCDTLKKKNNTEKSLKNEAQNHMKQKQNQTMLEKISSEKPTEKNIKLKNKLEKNKSDHLFYETITNKISDGSISEETIVKILKHKEDIKAIENDQKFNMEKTKNEKQQAVSLHKVNALQACTKTFFRCAALLGIFYLAKDPIKTTIELFKPDTTE